jgi:hypothetical protein
MDWVHQLWPAAGRKERIPLSTPLPLRRSHLLDPDLATARVGWKPHCEDARRRLLLFAWHERGTFVQAFDRHKTMVSTVYLQASDLPAAVADGSDLDLFNGTLLDVDAWPDGTYVVLDVLACCGFAVYTLADHSARRQRFDAAYAMHARVLQQYNIVLRPIQWAPTLRACLGQEHEEGTDRLHFVPAHAPYGKGRVQEWAVPLSRTLLLQWDGGQWLCGSKDHGRVPSPVVVAEEGEKKGVYACTYDDDGAWVVKARSEQRYPYSTSVVESLVGTVEEHLTLGELAKALVD